MGFEFQVRRCPTCFSEDVSYHPATRQLECQTCHKTFTFTRQQVNKDGTVKTSARNAIRYFIDGDFPQARNFATDVLTISDDYAPANYILAYFSEVIERKTGFFDRFFAKMAPIELEYDEMEELEQLIQSHPQKLIDHEEKIIELIAKNSQSPELKDQVREFFDKLCPYWIANRTSSAFLTPKLAEMYKDLAEYCDIPKTCYSLYNAIVKIPDSPCVDNTFFLETKSRHFYERFVLPVGEIIHSMSTQELRDKFSTAYDNRRKQFESKLT